MTTFGGKEFEFRICCPRWLWRLVALFDRRNQCQRVKEISQWWHRKVQFCVPRSLCWNLSIAFFIFSPPGEIYQRALRNLATLLEPLVAVRCRLSQSSANWPEQVLEIGSALWCINLNCLFYVYSGRALLSLSASFFPSLTFSLSISTTLYFLFTPTVHRLLVSSHRIVFSDHCRTLLLWVLSWFSHWLYKDAFRCLWMWFSCAKKKIKKQKKKQRWCSK